MPRRPRADGWTPEVQRTFIGTLADTGMVPAACRAVDVDRVGLSPAPQAGFGKLRARLGRGDDAAAGTLTDIAFQRAFEGTNDRDGSRIGGRERYTPPRVEENHPAAHARRLARDVREQARFRRDEDDGYGWEGRFCVGLGVTFV